MSFHLHGFLLYFIMKVLVQIDLSVYNLNTSDTLPTTTSTNIFSVWHSLPASQLIPSYNHSLDNRSMTQICIEFTSSCSICIAVNWFTLSVHIWFYQAATPKKDYRNYSRKGKIHSEHFSNKRLAELSIWILFTTYFLFRLIIRNT